MMGLGLNYYVCIPSAFAFRGATLGCVNLHMGTSGQSPELMLWSL